MKIAFRADMNPQIATGHVMRCLSIADEAKQRGIDTLFLGADENGRALVESRGHKYRSLESEWSRLEKETGRILSAICEESVSHIFVDSYYISPNYLREIRKHAYTVYIDDYGSEAFPVDMLLCYAVYAEKLGLNEKYASAKTKILSGPKYSPLRGMFYNLPEKEISERIRKVLVLSGGGDIYGVQERVLECIINQKLDFQIDVICGNYSEQKEKLEMMAENNDYVTIHGHVEDIKNHMCDADLCISAAGSTLYELCACGTPAISFTLADNQIMNAEGVEETGLIPYIGDIRRDQIEDVLSKALKELMPYEKRKNVSDRMQNLVDGRGSERIIDEIWKMVT